MKSSAPIWRYVVTVKLTVKILSIFVAFLGNMNFTNQTRFEPNTVHKDYLCGRYLLICGHAVNSLYFCLLGTLLAVGELSPSDLFILYCFVLLPTTSQGESILMWNLYIFSRFESASSKLNRIPSCVHLICRSWNFEYQVIFVMTFLFLLFNGKINFLLVKQENFVQ